MKAIKLSKNKNFIGYLNKVFNKEKEGNSKKTYLNLYVKDLEGKIIPLLFTEKELKKAKNRAEKNKEDIPTLNFLSKILIKIF